MKSSRHFKVLSLVVLLVSCSSFGVSSTSNIHRSKVEFNSPVNNIKGDYLIEYWDENFNQHPIVVGGNYNSNPVIAKGGAATSNGVIDIKAMFSIYPLEGVIHKGYQAYYISSPGDAASRFTVKSNTLNNGELTFSKESSGLTNIYQQVHIAYGNEDYQYRLFFFDSEYKDKYYVTIESSGVKLVKESSVSNVDRTIFNFFGITGQEALSTGLYVSTSSTRYDINSLQEIGRTAEEPKTSYPKFSKPFTFALDNGGFNFVNTYLDSSYKKHYSIPYYSNQLKLKAAFVYQSWHKNIGDFHWAQYMNLDAMENGRSWRLETMDNYLGEGDSNGKFVIQKYVNNSWTNIYTVDYPDGSYFPEFSLNWSEHLSTYENKFRIYFAYTIMSTARVSRDIFLISDEFYLSYDEISINDDFLPVLVNSLDVEPASSSDSGYGYSEESTYTSKSTTMWGEAYNVLTKNSLTKKGFKVKPLLQGYECHVSNDSGSINENIYYGEEASFTSVGAYTVTVKESGRVEKYKSYRLYVSGENVSSFLFDNIFSKKDTDESCFIRGNRIAVGYVNEELGIHEDSGYVYPTYLDSVTIKGKEALSYASNISVKIYRNEELVNEYSENIFASDYVINDVGSYHIRLELVFNKNSGVNCAYDFYFQVANKIIDSTINYKIVTSGTHEYYDLSSVVYIVNASFGPLAKDDVYVTYPDEQGRTKYERRIKYVVFGTYQEAYNYAMGQINLLMIKQEDGYYYYYEGLDDEDREVWAKYTEYEAYKFISSEAKSKVTRTYITNKDFNGFVKKANANIFNYSSKEDLPDRILVTYRKEDLERATHRQIINNYQFVTDEDRLVSSNVSLYDENNNLIDSNFPYFVKVEDYMKAHNLPSGKYTFIDTAPGMTATISRSYIIPYSATHNYVNAVTTISSLNGDTRVAINMDNKENKYVFSGGFNIESIVNELDHYSLLVVTLPNGQEEFDSINIINNLKMSEVGTYHIRVSDRVGNFYEFDVEVN